jgi:hypothetical protein
VTAYHVKFTVMDPSAAIIIDDDDASDVVEVEAVPADPSDSFPWHLYTDEHTHSGAGECDIQHLPSGRGMAVLDPSLEALDPTPDIRALYLHFDDLFFQRTLQSSAVEVKWSKRMTLCAGICSYDGAGGLCSIRLSEPLLTLRPRSDTVNTLLHEMIHAYLFVTKADRDRDGHGPDFQYHMKRINSVAGSSISVYHSFHEEVEAHRKHVWKCNGRCQHKAPYYGLVKRAMNRPPGPSDWWFARHTAECGGTYDKIEAPPTQEQLLSQPKPSESILQYFQPSQAASSVQTRTHTKPTDDITIILD